MLFIILSLKKRAVNKPVLSRIFRILFYVWMAALLLLSSLPNIGKPEVEWLSDFTIRLDYLFHFGAYGLLTLLYCLVYFFKEQKFFLRHRMKLAFLLLMLATADEFHQLLIPGRTFNPLDLLFNTLGVLVCLIFWPVVERIFSRS